MITTKTIARLFQIAAGTLLGDYSTIGLYHLGYALALSHLENTQDDDYHGFDREFEIGRHVRMGKGAFKAAKRAGMIKKAYHAKPSYSSCRSTECEGAYLRTE